MWQVDKIETRPAELDFSSSGGGRAKVRQVFFDDVLFSNAIGLVDWKDSRFQPLICEACGHEHCEPGSWLAVRRFGDHMVFMPALESMAEGEWEQGEYRPPSYIKTQGLPLFTRDVYAQLRKSVGDLPDFDALTPLTCAEVALLVQLEAPAQVLGKFPDSPKIGRDLIVAVSEGELSEETALLEDTISSFMLDKGAARVETGVEARTFYLDIQPVAEWQPLANVQGTTGLRLEPGLVFLPTEC